MVLTTRSVSTSRDSGLFVNWVVSQGSIFTARGRPRRPGPGGRPGPFDGPLWRDGGFLRTMVAD